MITSESSGVVGSLRWKSKSIALTSPVKKLQRPGPEHDLKVDCKYGDSMQAKTL